MKNKFIKAVDKLARAKALQPLLRHRWTETASMGVGAVTNPHTIWSSSLPTPVKIGATGIFVSAGAVGLLSLRCKELIKRDEKAAAENKTPSDKIVEPPQDFEPS